MRGEQLSAAAPYYDKTQRYSTDIATLNTFNIFNTSDIFNTFNFFNTLNFLNTFNIFHTLYIKWCATFCQIVKDPEVDNETAMLSTQRYSTATSPIFVKLLILAHFAQDKCEIEGESWKLLIQ